MSSQTNRWRKALKAAGYQLARSGSRHELWEHPATGDRVTLGRTMNSPDRSPASPRTVIAQGERRAKRRQKDA